MLDWYQVSGIRYHDFSGIRAVSVKLLPCMNSTYVKFQPSAVKHNEIFATLNTTKYLQRHLFYFV